jgi:hypothetical protein
VMPRRSPRERDWMEMEVREAGPVGA